MDAIWLQKQFDKNPNLNKAGLARAIGLSPSAISKMLSGMRQIKAQEYINMRRYFGLPAEESFETPQPAHLHETPAEGDLEWELPEQASNHFPKPLPAKVRPYLVSYDTGSVRFCRGDALILDTQQDVVETELPFVVVLEGREILALCRLDSQGLIHVRPLGGRMPEQRCQNGELEILGYIYGKMEIL